MKKIIFAAMLMFLFASPAFAALKPGEVAPTFTLRDKEGKAFVSGDYIGANKKESVNGVVLNFFASWCLPCRNELPLLNSLVDELKAKGVKVVIVGVKEDFVTINALLTELKVKKPVVLSDRDGSVSDKYLIRFYPVTFFIGADGTVKHIIFGEISDEKALRASVEKMMK